MGGGVNGVVGDDEFVVVFVARLEAVQDADRFFDGRLVHGDRLEAPFEGGVALDVFAVFVEGGGADDLNLPPREGGLEDVGRVHRGAG